MLPRRLSYRQRSRISRLLRAVAAVLLLVVFARWHWSGSSDDLSVGLVGNSQTTAGALRVYQQWSGALPATFYVWGEHEGPRSADHGRVVFLRPAKDAPALAFSDGMWVAVQDITQRIRCDYVFTHDDDLDYYLGPQATRSTLAEELKFVLRKYRPAIAGFPWKVGDERFESMRALRTVYEDAEVAPLTGFDNGMVVYHHSVLPLFFPFAPRGEGGFTGKWTLGAHFLQMFGPLIFGEHALRLNTLPYNNTVNMDNIPAGQGKTFIKDGLAYVPSSRHPYEYPLNEAYMSFLQSGLRDRSQPWGRQMGIEDVAIPEPWLEEGYSSTWILDRLNDFYDVRHEALSNTRLLRSTPQYELRALAATFPQPFSFKIILFTKNRLRTFQRCWESVRSALPLDDDIDVNVEVHVDFDPDMDDDDQLDYDEYLAEMEESIGPATTLQIIRKPVPMGLRASILSSWQPDSNHEFAIFLEDDIEVSPHFLRYAQKMVEAYVYRDHADHRLFTISLYNLRYNEAIESFVSVDNGHRPYIYQQPQSWGAIFMPEPWRRFISFVAQFDKGVDPLVPNSLTNRWPFAQSWKKYYLRFMVEHGGYGIYPNLPGGRSYSTNHVEIGTNDRPSETAERTLIHAKFRVPLLLRKDDFALQNYPPLSTLETYTLQQEAVSHVDLLPRGVDHVQSFDKCTMIITVYSRVETFTERLDHYHTLDRLGQILVLWNNPDYPPPQLLYTKYSIPVEVLKMDRNSLNNRFYPWPQIQYSCIVNMDDDWDMPHEHLKYAIDVWKGHFFDHLVGFSHQGRNHVQREVEGKELTLYSSTFLSPQRLAGKKSFYSIVLPSGFIYHRKYLDMYTSELPQAARDLVDNVQNCDDLLFNYMLANATGSGPILIEAWASMLVDLGNEGLWARPSHMGVRSKCLESFNQIFGHNPLKYTTSLFPIQREFTVPGLHHYTMSETIPFDYPCSKIGYETSEQCAMVMEEAHWDKAGGWV